MNTLFHLTADLLQTSFQQNHFPCLLEVISLNSVQIRSGKVDRSPENGLWRTVEAMAFRPAQGLGIRLAQPGEAREAKSSRCSVGARVLE